MPKCCLSEHGVLAIQNVTDSSSAAMRSEIVVLTIEDDLSFLTDSTHDRSPAVRRQR
jgi:hypothetical protein